MRGRHRLLRLAWKEMCAQDAGAQRPRPGQMHQSRFVLSVILSLTLRLLLLSWIHYTTKIEQVKDSCVRGVRSKSQSGEGIEALAGTNVARTRHKPAKALTPGGKRGVGVARIASTSNTLRGCPSL